LVEYNETNGTPGFQLGSSGDQVLSHYPLWNLDWTIATSATNYTLLDNTIGKLYEVSFTTSDNVFSYYIKFTGSPAVVDNVTISENEFKLGWTIQYYEFSGATNATGGLIALAGGLAVEAAAIASYHQANSSNPRHGVDVALANYRGFVNYENAADTWDVQANYARAGVVFGYVPGYNGFNDISGGFAGWEAASVILSYNLPNPAKIVHDPELGADVPSTPSSTTSGSPGSSTGGATSGSTASGSSSTGSNANDSAAFAVVSIAMLAAATLVAILL